MAKLSKFNISKEKGLIFLVFSILIVAGLASFFLIKEFKNLPSFPLPPGKTPFRPKSVEGLVPFSSKEDFLNYLEKAKEREMYFWALERGGEILPESSITAPLGVPKTQELEPGRVSSTNVQVPGIDEPDILKTDGKNIYFSPGRSWPIWRVTPLFERTIIPPPYKEPKIKVVKVFPPQNLEMLSEIDKTGDLLLFKDVLLVFGREKIIGFDIKNPKKPIKIWSANLENNTYVASSHLFNGKVYLVLKKRIDEFNPCPIKPLIIGEKEIEIKCREIYHPIRPIPADTTFFVMILDPESGKIEKKISFIGSGEKSVVYMSKNSLYITYPLYKSFFETFSQFLEEKTRDLLPNWIFDKITKLKSYDLSQEAKFFELENILQKYRRSLSEDKRLKLDNEMQNRQEEYFKAHQRELEKTGIVKIDIKDFSISAKGEIPGKPLNQFSLDEYKGYLRIATTVGERFFFFGFGTRNESVNDVYLLDEDLKIVGKIQNLGVGERIYSARFIEDKCYLVTFRQIDPFFVLDLKDPKNPELKGQLKIPGYSSYLHPITKDKILGIGKEDWKVKISLFDVKDPANPEEIAKYILDESFSDILSTHHAFLLDKKHQVFFIPGSKGGYIFSYKNDKLELKKAVAQISPRRAIYIDDYLYIVSDKKVVVLDENSWNKVNEISFK